VRPGGQRARSAPAERGAGLLPWLLGAFETVSSHRMLDRLIRGRMWIGLVAFALIGIVALQLGLLKLNSGIGRTLEREASLQRENAALSIENSELTSGDRVESQAAKLGMRLGSVSGLHFLAANPHADVGAAAQALKTPVQSAAIGAGAATGEAGGETGASAAPSESRSETSTAASAESATGEAGAGESPTAGEPGASGGSESSAEPSPESSGTPSSPPAPASESGGGTAAPGG
jgi:hypothetical protein